MGSFLWADCAKIAEDYVEVDGVMNRALVEIESLLPEDITGKLTSAHGKEILFLMSAYTKFKAKMITAADLEFDAKLVLNRTWEFLNVWKWIEVPVQHRQVYAIASVINVVALLHVDGEDALKKSLEVTDLGILLGYPLEEIQLTKVAEILSGCMSAERSVTVEANTPEICGAPPKRMKLRNEIDSCCRPSLESFYKQYFLKGEPVKLTNCMDHWPAMKLWIDFSYIKSKAGYRTVPIEIGKHYADSSFRQELMKISDFIDKFCMGEPSDVGYLAQHQLFDQVPELRKDIIEPDYCALSEKEEGASETDVNAWLGPKGTVSPLHFDPKHNLLCQVVGTKKITLYAESDSEFLYPREGFLKNTSRVDAEDPDLNVFPNFQRATPRECLLNPGEMLYIPPRYWHHVRSLDNSFSVSFWWD